MENETPAVHISDYRTAPETLSIAASAEYNG
jgi:hypothetical protein